MTESLGMYGAVDLSSLSAPPAGGGEAASKVRGGVVVDVTAQSMASALDVSVRAQVLNLLQDLKASLGLGLVFISHDINTVRYVSDRIAVMYFGRILELSTTEEIFANPQEEYTRTLLGAVPSLLDR